MVSCEKFCKHWLKQSTSKHGRHTFLYSAMSNGMQQAILGKSGSEPSSELQGQIARAFSSKILVNTMDMTAAIQYILTAAQLLSSQVYYKKSRRMVLGLAGVLFCKNELAQTKWTIQRKCLLGCLGKLGEVLKQQ